VAGRSKRKGTEETQAASGLKRRRVVVEVEPWNKPQELTEGEFRLRVVELMGMLVDEVNGVRHGLSLHNVLQQRSLCAREGLVPKGDLPVETFVYDGRVRVWGTEMEWVVGETDEESSEEEEEESGLEAGDDEGEEEEEDDDGDIVIEEQEQEEPEQDAEE